MQQETVDAAVNLYSKLLYSEGSSSFEKGTPQYALMDALMKDEQITNEIDRRLSLPDGHTARIWNMEIPDTEE